MNIRFKKLFIFLAFLLAVNACYTQAQWFLNLGVGPVNYVGDLRDKRFSTTQMQLSGMAGITYQPSPYFAVNLSLMAGKLAAKDANNGLKWKYRNLDFESVLFETALTAEVDLFDITQEENAFADQNPKKLTPYAFAGLAIFHDNPFTHDISGAKVYLAPLGTEGETAPYSLWNLSVPFGMGVKYALNSTTMLSAELSLRKTFTDYMDDVSHYHYLDTVALLASRGPEAASLSYRADEIPGNTYNFKDGYRGNPKKNDGYYSILVKISFQLFTNRPKFYYGY